MTTRRIIRAIARRIKHLFRPLRLRLIAHQLTNSEQHIAHLREMRDDLVQMERYENCRQVQLSVRRIEIELG